MILLAMMLIGCRPIPATHDYDIEIYPIRGNESPRALAIPRNQKFDYMTYDMSPTGACIHIYFIPTEN